MKRFRHFLWVAIFNGLLVYGLSYIYQLKPYETIICGVLSTSLSFILYSQPCQEKPIPLIRTFCITPVFVISGYGITMLVGMFSYPILVITLLLLWLLQKRG